MALDFARIKQTIASLAGELKKLRSEREALMRKREDLEVTPVSKMDLLQLVDVWIDRRAADFPRRLEVGLDYYRRHPLVTLPDSAKAPAHPLKVLTAVSEPNAVITLEGLEGSLFFVLRDQIKAGVRQGIESLDFSDAGPPRAERLETIAAIDKRIDELDTQERELIEQAEQSGLRLLVPI
jgi:hypothetical protein